MKPMLHTSIRWRPGIDSSIGTSRNGWFFEFALRPFLRAVVTVLVLVGLHQNGLAQTNEQTAEYRVKAAFLYKFGDYIEWPPQAFSQSDNKLVVGIVGADLLADELSKLVSGRTMGGRPVVVRKLKYGETIAGIHLLFVGRTETGKMAELLATIKGQAVLTVTESEQAAPTGGVINFVIVDDKVRFDIALPSAEQNNLKISARLLAVARKVISRIS